MLRYVLKRLILGILTVLCIYTATFVLMHSVDGDPLVGDKQIPEELMAQIREKYGLDGPIHVQYVNYLGMLSRGDLGMSLDNPSRSVNEIIVDAFPRSAVLGVLSLVFAASGGLLFGTLTAYYRNRLPDMVIMFLVIVCISVPGFVLAALLQVALIAFNGATGPGWRLPITGWDSSRSLWGNLPNLIIPALVLGLGTMAYLTRLMRSTMLEVVQSDYVRTARSKGLRPVRIFFRHELRNAALPVITVLGPSIAAITTGGFVVEKVFVVPGLGQKFVEAVQALDYPLLMGTTTFYGLFLVLMVVAVDMAYGFVDPRVRLE